MSHYDDEISFRPPRRAQTLPARFAPERERVVVQEEVLRRSQPQIPLRKREWMRPENVLRARFGPSTEGPKQHKFRSRARYQKARRYSDSGDDEIVVIEDHSPPPERERPLFSEYLEHETEVERERRIRRRIRRVRNRSGNTYEGYDSSADSEAESIIHEAYSFSLSRHTGSQLSQDVTLASASEPSEKDSSALESPILESGSLSGKVHCILGSRYTGDGIIGGLQSAKLTLIPAMTPGVRKGPSPIFRNGCQWISLFQRRTSC
jgi:hypothetical protein